MRRSTNGSVVSAYADVAPFAVAASALLASVLVSPMLVFGQQYEPAPPTEIEKTVYYVCWRYHRGGPLAKAPKDTMQEALKSEDIMKNARGLDDEPLYFDVHIRTEVEKRLVYPLHPPRPEPEDETTGLRRNDPADWEEDLSSRLQRSIEEKKRIRKVVDEQLSQLDKLLAEIDRRSDEEAKRLLDEFDNVTGQAVTGQLAANVEEEAKIKKQPEGPTLAVNPPKVTKEGYVPPVVPLRERPKSPETLPEAPRQDRRVEATPYRAPASIVGKWGGYARRPGDFSEHQLFLVIDESGTGTSIFPSGRTYGQSQKYRQRGDVVERYIPAARKWYVHFVIRGDYLYKASRRNGKIEHSEGAFYKRIR